MSGSTRRLGIFHNVGNGRRMFPLEALATGAENCGWEAEMVPLGSDTVENYDMIAVGGAPWKYRAMNLEATVKASTLGIPYLYIECGWLYKPRKPRHFFAYVNSFPYCPKFPCPHDRREKLNMKADFKPRGDEILIAGQSRGIDLHMEDLLTWLGNYTKRKIVYRPRRQIDSPKWVAMKRYEVDMDRTAEEALDNAWCVITDYSNMGGEALMRGIPVIGSHRASFSEFGGYLSLHSIDHIAPPSPFLVNDWLARMAYTLWSVKEFADGDAFAWILGRGLDVGSEKGSDLPQGR